MLRHRSLCAFVAVLCLVTAHATAGALSEEEVTKLAVPRMSTPPTIDGQIGEKEWREAAAMSGVTSLKKTQLVPRPTTFYLAWDKEHLYLAYRVYLRPNYKPRVSGRAPKMAKVHDDGAELVVKPMGQNVPATNKRTAYKFFLNALGYTGDLTKLEVGQQFKNWSPDFETAGGTTDPGTAPNGGSWLEVEFSATPDDFELDGPHQVGDKWRIMLGMNHMPIWSQVRIPSIGSYFESSGAGYTHITLVEDTPAVQFTMDSLDNLATNGTASMEISAYNPTEKAQSVDINVNVADQVEQDKTLKMPGGGSQVFSLDKKLPEDTETGKFSVRVTQKKQTLLSYTAFFQVGAMSHMMRPVKERDPNKFALSTQFNPVRKWVMLRADSYYLPEPDAAQALQYRVYPEGKKGKPLAQGETTDKVQHYFTQKLELPGLKPGTYVAEATLKLADGTELGPMRKSFTKKDESEAYPEWWGTKFGDINQVLPPFEAIKETEGSRSGWFTKTAPRFSCWGREYELNALGLPSDLTSQGDDVLSSAARVVVIADGKEHVIKIGNPEITDIKPWRVRFSGQAAGAGLDFSATGWLEQDGLVYVKLTYAPAYNTSVMIDALRLEYPLAEADAECLVCLGPGGNFAAKTTMILPKDRAGQLWSTLDTGRPGSQMTVGNFYPTVWVGNDERGFMWWSDTDKGWFPVNDEPAHEVVRTNLAGSPETAVIFRNNIISRPVELTEERTIRFSYNGTPFRPFTEGWRMVGATEDGTFVVPHRKTRVDANDVTVNDPQRQKNWMHPNSTSKEEWDELYAKWKKAAEADEHRLRWRDPYKARNQIDFGHMSFALHGYGAKTIFGDLYHYFGPEWKGDTWNESYRDYAMYLMDMTFGKGGVHSTYWDITFPRQYSSPMSALGYRLPDGRVQPEYNGWNLRRFFMRLQALAVKYDLFPNAVGVHSTNDYHLLAMPWIDAVLDGERNWNIEISDQDWVDYYPIERMRSMSSPHNWGVPICWMANIDGGTREERREAKNVQAQWIWMHDSWRNPYVRPLTTMPDSVLDWGLNEDNVVYHPYWRNPLVESSDEDVLVSLWELPDRVVLGVFNYSSDKRKDATLNVDLEALDLVPEKKWQEFVRVRTLWPEDEGGAKLNFHKRTLTLKNIAPHNLRLIGIRRY
jgi:hypothetical protein